MLSQEQLQALLTDLESDRVERTVSVNNTDKFGQAICAFANDFPNHRQPSYLIVGAEDSGRPSGLAVTDELLQNLAALRSDGNIQPLPAITVSKYTLAGGDLAVVEVLPSDLPPVRYKGKVWIRVGPRRATASEQEERILSERRISYATTFDALPCLGSTLADLSQERFYLTYLRRAVAEEVIAENQRPFKLQLASLRLFDLKQDCPTNAGILLLADTPTYYLAGAYVQFVRYAGDDMTSDVIDEKRAMGDLRTVLQTLDLLIDVNLRQYPVPVSTLRETTVSDYPKVAVRELLINAIMHRTYQSNAPVRFYWFADHIEINNPGGLYGEASPENFPYAVGYRNPVIAEAIRVLGYTNRFGQGVLRARKALELNGNPPAHFTFDPLWFAVRIAARSTNGPMNRE
jgi:ATP-dependent DNA helicase RecG